MIFISRQIRIFFEWDNWRRNGPVYLCACHWQTMIQNASKRLCFEVESIDYNNDSFFMISVVRSMATLLLLFTTPFIFMNYRNGWFYLYLVSRFWRKQHLPYWCEGKKHYYHVEDLMLDIKFFHYYDNGHSWQDRTDLRINKHSCIHNMQCV